MQVQNPTYSSIRKVLGQPGNPVPTCTILTHQQPGEYGQRWATTLDVPSFNYSINNQINGIAIKLLKKK